MFGVTLWMLDVSCGTYFVSRGYALSNVLDLRQNCCVNDNKVQKYSEVKIDIILNSVLKLRKFGVTAWMLDGIILYLEATHYQMF